MPKESYLINVSRGAIIDESALRRAIEIRRVLAGEPPLHLIPGTTPGEAQASSKGGKE